MLQEVVATGDLRVEGRFVDASNATLYAVAFSSELEIPVIYKPIAGERPLWDFPDGNLANRELAAFQLSVLLGLDLVPYTVLRDGPFGPGMVQQWIEIDEVIDLVALAESDHEDIRKMALFDAIINNTDRKYGHILPTPTGKIFGCDHGVTFHAEPKLRTVLWQFASQSFTIQELDLLSVAKAKASDAVKDLITPNEIIALLQRIDRLLELGVFPEPSQEWPSIPWPPF
ncbi:MAG: SCO1664 family protein [Actinomycetota bacterium]